MGGFLITVGLFNWMVTFFLLVAASLLCRRTICFPRLLVCALIAGIHSGICLLPQWEILSIWWCRLLVLCLVAVLSFGVRDLRRITLFALLDLSVTTFAVGFEKTFSVVYGLLGGLCIFGLFLLSPRGPRKVLFRLSYRDKTMDLPALEDTGNLLKDPITGDSVLVIDPVAAECLTGLKQIHLQSPVKTLEEKRIDGLRLIPYRTINAPTGFLLAVKMEYRRGGRGYPITVAFAPEPLDREGKIQGLIGGSV